MRLVMRPYLAGKRCGLLSMFLLYGLVEQDLPTLRIFLNNGSAFFRRQVSRDTAVLTSSLSHVQGFVGGPDQIQIGQLG